MYNFFERRYGRIRCKVNKARRRSSGDLHIYVEPLDNGENIKNWNTEPKYWFMSQLIEQNYLSKIGLEKFTAFAQKHPKAQELAYLKRKSEQQLPPSWPLLDQSTPKWHTYKDLQLEAESNQKFENFLTCYIEKLDESGETFGPELVDQVSRELDERELEYTKAQNPKSQK